MEPTYSFLNSSQPMADVDGLFRSVFENSAVPTAMLNFDTTIAMVNDAYCKLLGSTKDELIGMSWKQQIPPDEIDRIVEYNKKRFFNNNEAPSDYEVSFYTKQHERKQAHLFVKLVQEHNLIVISFADITDRKNAELLIAKQQEELKRLVNKLDTDLTRLTLQLVKNIEQRNLLTTRLQKLRQQVKTENISLVQKMDQLLEEISGWQHSDSWVKLRDHFENLHPTFMSKLLSKHPSLTPAEIKLCILLHLNMGTKEIASITSQAYDSVRVSRTRLRKKIKLETNNSLVAYLMQF